MRRKKDGLRNRGARFCWLGMTVSLVNLGDGFEDGGIIQDLFLVDAASDQGGDTEAVDLAGQTAGVLEDAFESIVAERGARDIPGNAAGGAGCIQEFL